jgi:hypothetical protein
MAATCSADSPSSSKNQRPALTVVLNGVPCGAYSGTQYEREGVHLTPTIPNLRREDQGPHRASSRVSRVPLNKTLSVVSLVLDRN